MTDNQTNRKNLRVPEFDYSQAGYYFVTVCTRDRVPYLRSGAQCAPEKGVVLPPLTKAGNAAEKYLLEVSAHYENIDVDKYVIMPNHIHVVFAVSSNGGRTLCAPTLSQVVKAWKEAVTKQIGEKIWQKGFYDHIIRNEEDYQRIWKYIDDNPRKWAEDKYHVV